jgi:hypothetical protein
VAVRVHALRGLPQSVTSGVKERRPEGLEAARVAPWLGPAVLTAVASPRELASLRESNRDRLLTLASVRDLFPRAPWQLPLSRPGHAEGWIRWLGTVLFAAAIGLVEGGSRALVFVLYYGPGRFGLHESLLVRACHQLQAARAAPDAGSACPALPPYLRDTDAKEAVAPCEGGQARPTPSGARPQRDLLQLCQLWRFEPTNVSPSADKHLRDCRNVR